MKHKRKSKTKSNVFSRAFRIGKTREELKQQLHNFSVRWIELKTSNYKSTPQQSRAYIAKWLKLDDSLNPTGLTIEQLEYRVRKMRNMLLTLRKRIESARKQLQNNEITEFIPITIPTLMSIWETERLLQALKQYGIKAHSIIVNQVNPENSVCDYCKLKHKQHIEIIEQLKELYSDEYFVHSIEMSKEEIRGLQKLIEFTPNVLPIFDNRK